MRINLDNLKFRKVAVATDFHLDHDREFVWGARGFPDRASHKSGIHSHLEALDPQDILVYLGDYALNTTKELVRESLRKIPCRTLLIWGNHPAGIKDLYKDEIVAEGFADTILGIPREVYPLEIEEGKYVMGDSFHFTANKKTYFASHFAPFIWDGMQHGFPCVCGHSHGNCAKLNPAEKQFGKILDCGVDNALKTVGRPFFWLDEVDQIMDKKQAQVWDHHAREK